MEKSKILIENGLIVKNSQPISKPFYGWLIVSGNIIEALGEGKPPASNYDRVIDGTNYAIIPGLVNLHAHSHSSLTRGSLEGLRLEEWLALHELEQAKLTEEQVYYAALGTYAENLLSGATTISDMSLYPEAVSKAAKEIGIRAVIAPYTADSKPFTPQLDETEYLLTNSIQDTDRVKYWVGLHDLYSCSDRQIRKGVELANKYGVGVHIHCSESRYSITETLERTGSRPIQHLNNLGGLGSRTVVVHCVHVDEQDIRIINFAKSSVAHCPHTNLKTGSGIAPVVTMHEEGINIGLGTDGAKANNRLDMFDVMKFASLIHKGVHFDPMVLPPEDILSMGTLHGAKALGINSGSLIPGMLADLTMIRLDSFHMQPARSETIVTNIVHSARGSDVGMVIVDGRIVVDNGNLMTVDHKQVFKKVKEIGHSLLESNPS